MTEETTTYDDRAVGWMLYPALVFLLVGMLVGVFISINGFLLPDYFQGEYIHFGKVRPVHVGNVTLLWLLSADVALLYYLVPRLCGVPLWSPKLAIATSVLWWFVLILGNFSYPFGTNWGWEYAELPFFIGIIPIKVLFVVAWLGVVVNLFATILQRKYKQMYVSLWYVMATLIWTTVVVYVGWFHLLFLPEGISRVNANFFYVHNLVGLIFTPMGLAAAYYFLPKWTGVPIYSHKLSMVGFWALAFSYSWIGAHHILHGPISQWLQTTSIIFSMWLFVPVFAVVTNLFSTLRGHWDLYLKNVPVKFLMMGNMFYLMTCIQGPLQSLRTVSEFTSKTDWIIGHSHVALFSTFTFFAYGGIYYVLPRIVKKPLWSTSLMEWHFSLSIVGALFFILPLWVGGFLQGIQWATWAEGVTYAEYVKNLSLLPFIETVALMQPWWLMRTLGGIMVTFAALLFVINCFNTVVRKPRDKEAAWA